MSKKSKPSPGAKSPAAPAAAQIVWKPTEKAVADANITRFMKKHGIATYDDLIRRCSADVSWFWEACLKDLGVNWQATYRKVLDDSKGFPWAKWFVGGQLNIVDNCIDRHLSKRAGNTALVGVMDDGHVRKWTYQELNDEVCRCAAALKELGIGKGDAVGIYMPMVPEVVAAFFACLKIGAVAVPIFSAFGAKALAVRLQDAEVRVLITADYGVRRGKAVAIKKEADEAAKECPLLAHMIVLRRLGADCPWTRGRDLWWHEIVGRAVTNCKTATLEAEDRSLIIYTSGTTGKPKGTVHTHAGCLAQMAKELGYYFDVKPDSVFFWVTDIGWMMGPWEMIGVTFFGATLVIYEGAPDYPQPDRLWDIVEDQRVSHLGISPTAVRLLMTHGEEWVKRHDLSTLRILGSTGETWDPESWSWFFRNVGGTRCPIINISGGTEIVGCLLAPLPITPLKPCTLRGPGLGMDVDVFDEAGQPIRGGIGHLVCKKPAPSMTKGFLKDPQRYLDTYFSKWPNVWYHGDWAKIDEDGFWFLFGRSDDTIKIAGKRTGPAEVEAALMEHPAVTEAAAIGVPHDIKGEALVCFAVLKKGFEPTEKLRRELSEQVVKHLGKTLRPELVKFVRMLPKTRSAKIVRGVIKKKFLGQDLGDVASVDNPDAIEEVLRAT
ncbi:MAG: AMP-binding protein [Planctomycetota bacterium]